MTVSIYKLSETVQTLHLEHLQIQRDHLLFVRDRHLRWMAETEDGEVRQIHQDLVDLLDRIVDRYEELIVVLEERD